MSRPRPNLVTVAVAVLAVYFVMPVDTARAPLGVVAGVAVSTVVLALVARIVFQELRGAQRRLAPWHLALALEMSLVVFAFAYYVVVVNAPAQFSGLSTRIDALYFATATTATVGFGDVHASGQVARALVTAHMVSTSGSSLPCSPSSRTE